MEGCKAWLIEDPAGQSGEVAVGEYRRANSSERAEQFPCDEPAIECASCRRNASLTSMCDRGECQSSRSRNWGYRPLLAGHGSSAGRGDSAVPRRGVCFCSRPTPVR